MQFETTESSIERLSHIDTNQFGIRKANEACVALQFGDTAAQQLMNGHIRGLARDIPKCNINRGQCIHQRAGSSEDMQLLLYLQHQMSNLRCVLTDAQWRDQFIDRQFR